MVTAKIKLVSKEVRGEGSDYEQVVLNYQPDYADGRNADWAAATPALGLTITVRPDVPLARHEVGQTYTLTFEKSDV